MRASDSLEELKRLIIERTGGNPFFMEETVQVLLDEGALVRDGTAVKLTKSLNALKIPPTVQAILASRIDRLPAEEKELLQTLAVLGREFPLGLARHVALKPDDELERMLSRLQGGEFIYEQPAFPEVEYIFKHALTQQVAYDSVLVERRKQLHERAGQSLESMFAGSWRTIWAIWRIITAAVITSSRRSNTWGVQASRRYNALLMLMRSVVSVRQ